MSTKVMLLGRTGMLGRYVQDILKRDPKIDLICPNRVEVHNLKRSDFQDGSVDVVINCIGAIPQRQNSNAQMVFINTQLPLRINKIKGRAKFIHITTDCVYSGKKGDYVETDAHDETSCYGSSKSKGEPKDACILRTSIIGLAPQHGRGLLEWVKGHKRGDMIKGYTNHIWNGVTCLTLAEELHRIVKENDYWIGPKHYHADKVTKCDLVSMINEVWDLGLIVTPFQMDQACDRTLKGTRTKCDIMDQLVSLEQFVFLYTTP